MFRNIKGSILPLAALLITGLLAMGGLAVDMSYGYLNQTKVKNAVDLAALAGTSQLTNQASISNAKNTALQYLNDNLTMTFNSFAPLSLSSSGLSIQVGVYDSTNMTFTFDEASPNVNSIRISYTYNSMTFLASIFGATNLQASDTAISAKQPAARAQPGTGFPMVIYSTALDDALANGNMVNLYSAGNMDNSFWTDFTDSNPSTTDIRRILDYFQTGVGTSPPGISVEDAFRVTVVNVGGIYMNMNPNSLVGMTFLFSLVTPLQHYPDHKLVKADGFVAGTINNIVDSMGQKYVGITIQPGYVDNTFGGLQLGSGMTNVSPNNQSLLSNSFGLVQ